MNNYRVIIIDKDGKTYKKVYKYKPSIYKGSKRNLPKNVNKMYSFGYISRVMDLSLEDYENFPEWKY